MHTYYSFLNEDVCGQAGKLLEVKGRVVRQKVTAISDSILLLLSVPLLPAVKWLPDPWWIKGWNCIKGGVEDGEKMDFASSHRKI